MKSYNTSQILHIIIILYIFSFVFFSNFGHFTTWDLIFENLCMLVMEKEIMFFVATV